MLQRYVLAMMFALAAALPAWADYVVLKNGERIEGEIIQEDDDVLIIRHKYGTMTVQRDRIVFIHRDTPEEKKRKALQAQAAADKAASDLKRKEAEAATASTIEEPGAKPVKGKDEPESQDEKPDDPFVPTPDEQKKLDRLKKRMRSTYESTRLAAKRSALALKVKAIRTLIEIVNSEDVEARILAAQALGTLRNRSAIKALIERIGQVVPRGPSRTKRTKRRLAHALRDSLNAISGRSFKLNPRLTRQRQNIEAIEAWWKDGMLKMPRQADEPFFTNEKKPPDDILSTWRRLGASPPATWQPEEENEESK